LKTRFAGEPEPEQGGDEMAPVLPLVALLFNEVCCFIDCFFLLSAKSPNRQGREKFILCVRRWI